ncbi:MULTISPECIES: lytic transglycosylase domain-containing protein [Thermodesulfobacterium]|jgi:membrane-bound lytic murein transglycosylase D|uniref:Transglycosylase SLT domain-containing protein n=1 Tax=Thermodesulfobacterium commune TaxID=1741 RepID=A0A101FHU9_9BACT|nr:MULTISPECIES: lytic transglycosylase domain-containing protein [Thermodesulfobacterium]KUJ97483.1 MAG: Lytic transglycosylase catalytic [Thermodesulfobacterium sp. 37_54]KUK19338.1 MAG: Lytic transglycosylase catalytic [Thermodesulfobacterium commune]KUK37317.1 MAG: Lytic transglycosylase catalytic [Thermodesulfobacterium commune]MBZ4681752.1 lytic transglycosylase protein [Thermodesulfobacterium sp.]MDK2861566.1 rane-bound lytic murein transglycosylase [Thermodesulfobacterium sp.]
MKGKNYKSKRFKVVIRWFSTIVLMVFLGLSWNLPAFPQNINPQEEEVYEVLEELPPKVIKNLPQDINDQVAYFIKYFTKDKREVTERWLKRCSPYLPYFKTIFREYGVPEDLVYLAFIESGCNPFAISRAGAVGIWQFMEKTGRFYGLKIDYWVDERKDFIKSTHAAARYLKRLYDIFGDWRPAVASYNLGEGRLLRILRAKNFIDYWQLLNSGSLPLETAAYLPQWMAITFIIKNPQKYGFQPLEPKALEYEEMEVNGGVDLKVFAVAGQITYDLLLMMNAELRRQITPPGKPYLLKVPQDKKKEIQANLNRLKLKLIEKTTTDGTFYIVTLANSELSEKDLILENSTQNQSLSITRNKQPRKVSKKSKQIKSSKENSNKKKKAKSTSQHTKKSKKR